MSDSDKLAMERLEKFLSDAFRQTGAAFFETIYLPLGTFIIDPERAARQDVCPTQK